MNWRGLILLVVLVGLVSVDSFAQCSLCSKTAEQMGEGPASALNKAIVYLMGTPFAIMGVVMYRWWKKEKKIIAAEKQEGIL